MQSLADYLRYHAARLGIDLKLNPEIDIHPKLIVRPKCLIRNFGGPSGMLVFTDFNAVRDAADDFSKAGYGVSILSDPFIETSQDADAFDHMLKDWGWSGNIAAKPQWMKDGTSP
jgi:hypothetical protein